MAFNKTPSGALRFTKADQSPPAESKKGREAFAKYSEKKERQEMGIDPKAVSTAADSTRKR